MTRIAIVSVLGTYRGKKGVGGVFGEVFFSRVFFPVFLSSFLLGLTRKRIGKVEREDEDVQEHQTGKSGVTVSNATGQRTGDENTNQRSQLPSNLYGGLPGRGNDILLFKLVPDTVILGEGRKGQKVAHEEDVVRLHDDGTGHLDSPLVDCSAHLIGTGGINLRRRPRKKPLGRP